jgi:uncharacterized protein
MNTINTYSSFAGDRLISSDDLNTMILQTKDYIERHGPNQILIFEDQTGIQIDFDFRGTHDEVLSRLATHPHFISTGCTLKTQTGPGRPKLGVVCREVSLLPRHWEWLERQPSGISGTLRKLVDDARKREPGKERVRLAREAAYKFMTAMAGNLPGFEEASRALFAGNRENLETNISTWPIDIREHVKRLVDYSESLEKESGPSDELV